MGLWSVLEEVVEEEWVAADPLDGFDEKVCKVQPRRLGSSQGEVTGALGLEGIPLDLGGGQALDDVHGLCVGGTEGSVRVLEVCTLVDKDGGDPPGRIEYRRV